MNLQLNPPSINEILEKAEITAFEPDPKKGGYSREVNIVNYKGKKYILRICNEGHSNHKDPDKNAVRYENYCGFLEEYNVTPKLLERNGRCLLFEYLEGVDCIRPTATDFAFEAGKIAGLSTKIPPQHSRDPDEKFHKSMDYLLEEEVIDSPLYEKIKKRYSQLKPEKIETQSELIDTTLTNFRLSNGRIYLVDIESIVTEIKGRCFARSFLRSFQKPEQRELFLQGYNSVADSSFLTEDYLQYLYLLFLTKNIHGRVKGKHINPELDPRKPLKELDLLLKGELR